MTYTGQRSLTQLVVEAAYGVTKTLESADFIAGRYDVDVAYLLRSADVTASAWDHPQSVSGRHHNTAFDNVVCFLGRPT